MNLNSQEEANFCCWPLKLLTANTSTARQTKSRITIFVLWMLISYYYIYFISYFIFHQTGSHLSCIRYLLFTQLRLPYNNKKQNVNDIYFYVLKVSKKKNIIYWVINNGICSWFNGFLKLSQYCGLYIYWVSISF